METPTSQELIAEDFLSFLRTCRLDDYSELLHDALYCLATEGDASDRKQLIYHALYSIRTYLNACEKQYLPAEIEKKKESKK